MIILKCIIYIYIWIAHISYNIFFVHHMPLMTMFIDSSLKSSSVTVTEWMVGMTQLDCRWYQSLNVLSGDFCWYQSLNVLLGACKTSSSWSEPVTQHDLKSYFNLKEFRFLLEYKGNLLKTRRNRNKLNFSWSCKSPC